MSIPDSSLINYFELCTYTSLSHIEDFRALIISSESNPRDIKMNLAEQVVTMYHGKEAAEKAKEGFILTFKKGGVPDDIQETQVSKGSSLSEILVSENIVASKSELRRLMDEGAVRNMKSGDILTDPYLALDSEIILKVGKRRFIKIKVD